MKGLTQFIVLLAVVASIWGGISLATRGSKKPKVEPSPFPPAPSQPAPSQPEVAVSPPPYGYPATTNPTYPNPQPTAPASQEVRYFFNGQLVCRGLNPVDSAMIGAPNLCFTMEQLERQSQETLNHFRGQPTPPPAQSERPFPG